MINTYKEYTPDEIKNFVEAIEPLDISELIRAVMVLCDTVKRLERRVDELESDASPV